MTLDDLRALYTLPEGDHLSIDSMSVELEVAELLYALVRQSKPNVVVECGSGKGYASRFIAEALRENDRQTGNHGHGYLVTYEHDPVYYEIALGQLKQVGISSAIFGEFSYEHALSSTPDLVFIDSLGGEPRERDMDHWFACAARPVIVIHDANGYPPETFARGEGVLLQAGRGVWVGRARS